MRIRGSRRNPKGLKFTPEQEAEYERYERSMASARIFEMGVSAFLAHSEYGSQIEMEEASRILRDAVEIRKQASDGREAIRKAAHEAELVPVKRSRKAKAK
jgi:hypothetical protein